MLHFIEGRCQLFVYRVTPETFAGDDDEVFAFEHACLCVFLRWLDPAEIFIHFFDGIVVGFRGSLIEINRHHVVFCLTVSSFFGIT